LKGSRFAGGQVLDAGDALEHVLQTKAEAASLLHQ
jgi:hypothetical protein